MVSFLTGIFPDQCKIPKFIPIFKKKMIPLTVVTVVPPPYYLFLVEISKKMFHTRMYEFLEKNKLVYNWKLCNHALISMTEYIKSYFNNGEIAAGIFITQ